MRKIRYVNPSRLRELFIYDPITGVVCRLTGPRAGKPCGTLFSTGHLQVSVDSKMIGVHRIAWALHHDEYPQIEIDHINGDGADNRLCNLRVATSSQNNQNRRLSSRNKTGIKCVFRVKWGKRKAWRVSVGHHNGEYYITHFECLGRAVKHATEMRSKFHDQFARSS